MTTVEEVLYKAKELADAAGKKTGELVSLTKLKMEVATVQKEIAAELESIGRLVYEAHKNGTSAEEALPALFDAVDTLETKAVELTAEIERLQGMRHCTACGKNNAADAAFCQNCGGKL